MTDETVTEIAVGDLEYQDSHNPFPYVHYDIVEDQDGQQYVVPIHKYFDQELDSFVEDPMSVREMENTQYNYEQFGKLLPPKIQDEYAIFLGRFAYRG